MGQIMKISRVLITAAIAYALAANAQAAKKPSAKDAQIAALEQRLALLEKRLLGSASSPPQAAPEPPLAAAPALRQLDQKVKVLERKLEVEQEKTLELSKKTPKLEAGPEGVRFASADGDHVVRLRGSVQADGKFFLDDNRTASGEHGKGGALPDKFELKQARIWLEGRFFKHFDFKLMPDFGNGQTILADAYIDMHYFPYASLNFGKQKTPISLERLQGDSDGVFLERAFPTYLASNRDIGIMLHGGFAKPGYEAEYAGPLDFKNFASYQLGVFNGGGDNGAGDADKENEDDKEFAGRLWAHPFQHSGIDALEGLGVGVAGSWEVPRKNKTVLKSLKTELGQTTIVDYAQLGGAAGANTKTTSLFADADHYRVYPQVYWYYGPFGLLGEYVLSSQKLLGGKANKDSLQLQQNNTAWQVQASYVLTGEDNTFQSVKPRHAFDPINGHWGAVQVAARWSELDIDDDSFRIISVNKRPFQLLDPSKSVSKATAWAIGASWFFNRNVRLMADYEQTYFEGGAGTLAKVKDRPTEKIFSTRMQLVF
jgi:phosphate-selective porin OprO/OprP